MTYIPNSSYWSAEIGMCAAILLAAALLAAAATLRTARHPRLVPEREVARR